MGGKAFPDTVPVPDAYLSYAADEIEKILRSAIGRMDWVLVGSSRFGERGDHTKFYNDIDVSVVMTDENWVLFTSNLNDLGYVTKKITPHSVSVAVKDKLSDSKYQIDFLQSQNLTFSDNAYWSDKRSLYKGAHRNILLTALINVLTTKETKSVRTKEHLDLYEGLVYLVQTKNEGVKRYTTIDKRVLLSAKDCSFEKLINRFLPEIMWYDLASFETVYRVINNKYFEKGDSENVMMTKIMTESYDIFKTTKLEIPHEIKCWVNVD